MLVRSWVALLSCVRQRPTLGTSSGLQVTSYFGVRSNNPFRKERKRGTRNENKNKDKQDEDDE